MSVLIGRHKRKQTKSKNVLWSITLKILKNKTNAVIKKNKLDTYLSIYLFVYFLTCFEMRSKNIKTAHLQFKGKKIDLLLFLVPQQPENFIFVGFFYSVATTTTLWYNR